MVKALANMRLDADRGVSPLEANRTFHSISTAPACRRVSRTIKLIAARARTYWAAALLALKIAKRKVFGMPERSQKINEKGR
jgi:hypothetical protein